MLRAYSESLRNVFYFLVGAACLATILSLGMGWKGKDRKATVVVDEERGGEKVAGEERRSDEITAEERKGEEIADKNTGK